jgi:hypothetical protein
MSKEFKVGQRWLMRNGQVATIETIDPSEAYPVSFSFSGQTRSVGLDGMWYSEKQKTNYDLMEPLDKSQPQLELSLDDYLRISRDDLVSQTLRLIEIADKTAEKRNWESVVKLKMLKAMLQQVIEHEGTL